MDNDVYVIVPHRCGRQVFFPPAQISKCSRASIPHSNTTSALHANEMLLRLEHTPKLVIAAINGTLRRRRNSKSPWPPISASHARCRQKLGLPEVNLGVLPGTGGTQRLSRPGRESKAIELMVTGNTFSFEEAKEFRHPQRHLRARRLHGKHHGVRPPIHTAQQGPQKPSARIKRAVQTGWEIPMEFSV